MKRILLCLAFFTIACEKVKPPDPMLSGATKTQTFAELEKNVGKKVYFSGYTKNVEGRAAVEIQGGVVFLGVSEEFDEKTGRVYLTVCGTLRKEEGDSPAFSVHDYQARGMGMGGGPKKR
jgi:hypothetical protein